MTYLSEIVKGKRVLTAVLTPTFEKKYDVIVCGLGTAGSLAALFSAENDLSVLGIEAFTCVGGTHTAGGITGHYFGCPGGRYEKLEQKVVAFSKRYTCTTAESRKFLTEQALCEQGAEILYQSSVCGVYLEENSVVGLRVLTESGIVNYGAKIVMDCTAEAYVAVMAGCKTEMGRKTDGQMQPYSLVSMVFDGENTATQTLTLAVSINRIRFLFPGQSFLPDPIKWMNGMREQQRSHKCHCWEYGKDGGSSRKKRSVWKICLPINKRRHLCFIPIPIWTSMAGTLLSTVKRWAIGQSVQT